MLKIEYVLCLFFVFAIPINAKDNFNNSEMKRKMTCIFSNGTPSHEIGKFPNRANPNMFKEQKLSFCFPSVPHLTEKVTWGLMTVGVSITGIPIRPYTAAYFDPTAKKGYSRDPSSGWRKQAMHDPQSLGIDAQNGHVDRSGLYHYHGVMKQLNDSNEDILIGYAPDGFKIVYRPSGLSSSYRLKTGKRPSPPGGIHNGRFEEDFEYLSESGALDECNGLKINNVYTYFVTTSYPFYPRCFKGEVNVDFMARY